MLVHEVMTRDVHWATPDVCLMHVARLMRDLRIGALPILDRSGVVGILTQQDIVRRAIACCMNPVTTAVQEIMTRNVIVCHQKDSIETVLQVMTDQMVHHLVVYDDSGVMTGILSLFDLATRGPPDLLRYVSVIACHGMQTRIAESQATIRLHTGSASARPVVAEHMGASWAEPPEGWEPDGLKPPWDV